jgi:hypothetical protein
MTHDPTEPVQAARLAEHRAATDMIAACRAAHPEAFDRPDWFERAASIDLVLLDTRDVMAAVDRLPVGCRAAWTARWSIVLLAIIVAFWGFEHPSPTEGEA